MNDAAIYIALGANLPSRGRTPLQTIAAALEALNEAGLPVVAASSAWSSPAWPDPSDPPYVNAVARIESGLPPRDLLDALHAIEADFGRERSVLNAPRPLDLDLLDHSGQVLKQENGLEIPHPRAVQRAFVLLPLQEIAPDWQDPVSGMGIEELVARLPQADRDAMSKLQTLASGTPESLAFARREG
ncbi:2-amino-4-hydroxy-6-hydroxymethyldihydropteridine diphosphokinase [Maricaulis parjimensis]|uniref:2-amino-4-hydroxy-6- hydroxymethyldihydropteridine diphosphokinase n=1 Tax=Maricaulis parjimensis TaxID=144023 RepID=UPI00193ADF34|nr:2-amino-4-hydroxy-6-hydroxymethyldihydropteridine diphosphokinase [Maricaulis parjimensis]